MLGHPAAHVCGAAVYFAGVFAGEGAAAVVGHAAVGVADDFTPCEATVGLSAAEDEASGGVDMVRCIGAQEGGWEGSAGYGLAMLADGFDGDVL